MYRWRLPAAAIAILALAAGTGAIGTILVTDSDIDSGSGLSRGPVIIDPEYALVAPPTIVAPETLPALGSMDGALPAFSGAGTGADGIFTAGTGVTLAGGTYNFTSYTIDPEVTVTYSSPVTIRVTGDVLIQGAIELHGGQSPVVLRVGGDLDIPGGDAATTDRGIFTTGSGSSIDIGVQGDIRLGDPMDSSKEASIHAFSGDVTLTGHGPAAEFTIGNTVVATANGIMSVRGAGAVTVTGSRARVRSSTGQAQSTFRLQAFGGNLTIAAGAIVQADTFSGDMFVEASGSVSVTGNSEVTGNLGPSVRLGAFGGGLLIEGSDVTVDGSAFNTVQASAGIEIRDDAQLSSLDGPMTVIAHGGDLVLQPADAPPAVIAGAGAKAQYLSVASFGTANLSSYSGPILLAASNDVYFGNGAMVTSFSGRTDVDAFGDVLIVGSDTIILGSFMGDVEVAAAGSISAEVDLPEGPNGTVRGGTVGMYAGTGGIDLDDLEVDAEEGELTVVGQGPVAAAYELHAALGLFVESAAGNIDVSGARLTTDPTFSGDSGSVLVWCHLLNGSIDASFSTIRSGDADGAGVSGGNSGSVSLLVNGAGLPPVASFILPKNISAKVNAADPLKSRLVAAGFLDTGPDEVDLTAPATVDVGDLSFEVEGFTANRSATKFTYKSPGLVMAITGSKVGSSRAKFRLVATGDFADAPGLEEEITLRFANQAAEGLGIVDLDAGRYTLGRKRGALVEPNISLFRAKAVLKGGGDDVLTLKLGLATNGTTPGEAPDVLVGFGGFEETIPGDLFMQSGDRFLYRGESGAVTQVILDYLKETVTIKAAGVNLGEFPEGGSAVPIRVGLGGDQRVVTVRMGKKGSAFIY